MTDGFSSFKDLVYYFVDLITLAIPVVGGLALLAFLWGLAQFIRKSGDPKALADGKKLMIWGVVALFVMISFQGIISIAQGIFGITPSTVLPIIKSNK